MESERLDNVSLTTPKMPLFDSALERPRVIVTAYNEKEAGLPLVELRIDGVLHNLKPEQAERIGAALLRAEQVANGPEEEW